MVLFVYLVLLIDKFYLIASIIIIINIIELCEKIVQTIWPIGVPSENGYGMYSFYAYITYIYRRSSIWMNHFSCHEILHKEKNWRCYGNFCLIWLLCQRVLWRIAHSKNSKRFLFCSTPNQIEWQRPSEKEKNKKSKDVHFLLFFS